MLHRASGFPDSCEHSNEASVYIKGRKLLYYLSDYQLLKEDSAPRS